MNSIGKTCRELAPRLRRHAEAMENQLTKFAEDAALLPLPKQMQFLRFASEARDKIKIWRDGADQLDQADKANAELSVFLDELRDVLSGKEGLE